MIEYYKERIQFLESQLNKVMEKVTDLVGRIAAVEAKVEGIEKYQEEKRKYERK